MNENIEYFFKTNQDMDSVLVVGDVLFLPSDNGSARHYAERVGSTLKQINRYDELPGDDVAGGAGNGISGDGAGASKAASAKKRAGKTKTPKPQAQAGATDKNEEGLN